MDLPQLPAVFQAGERQTRCQRKIPHAKIGLVGIGIDHKGIRRPAQVRRVMKDVVRAAAKMGDGGIGGHAGDVRPLQMGGRGTQGGPALDFVVRLVEVRAFKAGEHPMVAFGVVARAVMDAAKNREFVGDFGLFGHISLNCMPGTFVEIAPNGPRNWRNGIGLGIPGFMMARSAAHPN